MGRQESRRFPPSVSCATAYLEVLLVAPDVVLHQEVLLLHEAAVLVVQVPQQHLVQNHGEVQVLGGPLPGMHNREKVRSSWVPMWWSMDPFEEHMRSDIV